MKFFQKSIVTLALLFHIFPAALFAGDGMPEKPKTIQEQIAAYISYPQLLQEANAGVGSLSFKLTCDNRITAVEAHSGISESDTFLEQALSGKLIVPGSDTPAGKYRIRLRFRQA